MKQNYQLVGTYQREGSKLISENLNLLISKRKNTSPTKPPYFIVNKTSSPKGDYISSLYPLGNNEFKIDFQGTNYKIIFEEQVAHISM
jgi:hypothetical protein